LFEESVDEAAIYGEPDYFYSKSPNNNSFLSAINGNQVGINMGLKLRSLMM